MIQARRSIHFFIHQLTGPAIAAWAIALLPADSFAETQMIFRTGMAAPQMTSGITFGTFTNSLACSLLDSVKPSIARSSDHLLFATCLNGPGMSWSGTGRAVYKIDQNGTSELVYRGDIPYLTPSSPAMSLTSVSMNSVGDLHLQGTFYGAGVTSSNDSVLFAWPEEDAMPMISAREGDVAFGLSNTYFSSFSNVSGMIPTSSDPVLFFNSQLTGSAVNGTNNVLLVRSQAATSSMSNELFLRVGDNLPGSSDGTRILSINRFPSQAPGALVSAQLFGPNTNTSNNRALLRIMGGVQKVLRTGDPAPLLAPGVVISEIPVPITDSNRPVINADLDAVIFARISGPNVTVFNNSVLYALRNGSLQLLARDDDLIPCSEDGSRFYSLASSSPRWIDDQGRIILSTQIRVGTSTSGRALVRFGDLGQCEVLARSGMAIVGREGTQLYTSFASQLSELSFNEAGDIIFIGWLQGPNVILGSERALIKISNGGPKILLQSGQVLNGHRISTFVPQGLQINEAGQSVVVVLLNDTTYKGLVAFASNDNPELVIAPGLAMNLSGGSMATISSSSYGYSMDLASPLTESGKFAFATRITDANGSGEGIFIHTITNDSIPNLCRADTDGNGVAEQIDITLFLTSYFAGNADYDQNGITQVSDIFAFLNDWFEGC